MTEVLLQPTVLFQIADHRRRRFENAQTNQQRVVGCLVGLRQGNKLIINNSFPIPFDENPQAYYVDTEYAKHMAEMFKKVYSDENLIGYYTTSPQFRAHDSELATRMMSLVGPECYLLNVDCLDQNNLEPFYKLYTCQSIDQQTQIQPKETTLHWSLVEKVVLAAPEQKRELVDVLSALNVMESEILQIIEYMRGECDLEIVDRVQNLLNIAVDEPGVEMIRRSNDNAVQIVLGELVRVIVQMKKNQEKLKK
ncbi:26S_proteasome non-ATPase regulatory subunit [Hexamita inflata]|uniref:26S proteasome non-ATPase regulatory subunit n=1 Tax=Hexamita inflata TaxID=28002 RepID=A0AA86UQ37_9EUKA|nr:26S proteasome non-ATPase regulatory subunit [Hexamita inflata]CAI9955665.1 26S proteasome non-ATPase regulatory subunit [Hexamita inflata]CAI9963759.1 26S proteasome non-ATPase regulatory subunit [Hexamita inflata]